MGYLLDIFCVDFGPLQVQEKIGQKRRAKKRRAKKRRAKKSGEKIGQNPLSFHH